MATEVIQFLLIKFSSLLVEAEQHPTPVHFLSRFKSIFSTMNSILQDEVDWKSVDRSVAERIKDDLYDVIDALSECILLARQRDAAIEKGLSVRYWFRNLSGTSRIFSNNRVKSQLHEIEKKFKHLDLPMIGVDCHNHNSIELELPSPEPSEIIGFDGAAKRIECLLTDESEVSRGGLVTIGIVGMAGSGKTALAHKVFDRMKSKFDISIWFCLSQTGQNQQDVREDLLKHVLDSLGFRVYQPGIIKYEIFELLKLVKPRLEGKKYLLVLDEVWDVDDWYADLAGSNELSDSFSKLSDGLSKGSGSAIMVMSRFDNVARMMVGENNVINRDKVLSEVDIWSVFKKNYKNEDELIEKLKDEIIEYCDGLPSIAKGIAETLSNEKLFEIR